MKLVKKAYESFDIIADSDYKSRMVNLEKVNEYGFAILILWNRIEIMLKLLRYYRDMPVFPDKLDFINKKWNILNTIYKYNPDDYDLIFNREKSTSLWRIRDKIAHASSELNSVDYEIYKTAANQILTLLSQNLLSQNDFKAKRGKMKK